MPVTTTIYFGDASVVYFTSNFIEKRPKTIFDKIMAATSN